MYKKGSAVLIVTLIVVLVVAIAAIITAVYYWQKNKEKNEISTTMYDVVENGLPTQIVENFMKHTLGTIPDASLDFTAARNLATQSISEKYPDDVSFAAQFYGIQDGPTKVEAVDENITDSGTATVKVNAFWNEMGLGWVFYLDRINGEWLISDFRNDAQ